MAIYCQQTGAGSHCVLLHGWGFHSGIWQGILPALAAKYTVTCIDLPGFGNSVACPMPANLDELLQALGVTMPANSHLIGWSLGGLLALALAAKDPSSFQSVTLLASTPRFAEAPPDWPGMPLAVLENFAQQLQDDHQATLKRFLRAQLHQVAQGPVLLKRIEADLFAAEQEPPSLDLWGFYLQLLQTLDLRDALRDLPKPVLGIFGALDAIVPQQTVAALQAESYEHAQWTLLSKAGHVPFLTHPEATLALLTNFIDHHDQTRSSGAPTSS